VIQYSIELPLCGALVALKLQDFNPRHEIELMVIYDALCKASVSVFWVFRNFHQRKEI
jgi:hypothetical protein